LDHINVVNSDNRIENLRIVCPNCNAGLETHGGKNVNTKYNYVTYGVSDNTIRKWIKRYKKLNSVVTPS